jgi:hypothetical protein
MRKSILIGISIVFGGVILWFVSVLLLGLCFNLLGMNIEDSTKLGMIIPFMIILGVLVGIFIHDD